MGSEYDSLQTLPHMGQKPRHELGKRSEAGASLSKARFAARWCRTISCRSASAASASWSVRQGCSGEVHGGGSEASEIRLIVEYGYHTYKPYL